jgi:hypothetical protein
MTEPELVKFRVSRTHWSFAQIIFLAGKSAKEVSIRRLQWLDGARTPLSTLLYASDELKFWPFVPLKEYN